MLLAIDVGDKSFGHKMLYTGLKFDVQPGEKIGLIGRNGTGKSTLFSMITGDDKDYQGEIQLRRSAVLIASRQEHHGLDDTTVLEYIQGDLPEYAHLAHIIDTSPETMGEDTRKIERYSEALERFNTLGYFQIEDELGQALGYYQLDPALLHAPMGTLSGGQKRMVELIKVQRSRGDLALIDEPTNHMDYVAKAQFVKWLKSTQEAVIVITHDRDVLQIVDRIIEIRDGKAYPFKGNYAQYLRSNKNQVISQVNEFDVTLKRIENLKADVTRFQRLKEKSRDPGTIRRFKSQEQRARAELAELEKTEKPSFWIDQESVGGMNDKLTAAYEKYKAKNIQVARNSTATKSARLLVQVDRLSLGYGERTLFDDVSFALHEGERVRLHGRNGVGKTTIVQAIMAKVRDEPVKSDVKAGHILVERDIRLGLYEQEIDERFLKMRLYDAIEQSFLDHGVQVSDQRIKQQLGNYLFNPVTDGDMLVSRLSGGQKARLQLIRMLVHQPQLLILDEPTNHLDLPSIEELENALKDYHGAVIYISHDSYFADKLGGQTVQIGS